LDSTQGSGRLFPQWGPEGEAPLVVWRLSPPEAAGILDNKNRIYDVDMHIRA